MTLTILAQIGVGLLGVLFYTLLAFRKYLKSKEIQTTAFWHAIWLESRFIWGWTVLMLVIASLAVTIVPGGGEAVTALTGIEITQKIVSFFTVGTGLSGLVDSNKAKK